MLVLFGRPEEVAGLEAGVAARDDADRAEAAVALPFPVPVLADAGGDGAVAVAAGVEEPPLSGVSAPPLSLFFAFCFRERGVYL